MALYSIFRLGVESNPGFPPGFHFTAQFDWSRNLLPSSKPITFKTKTSRDSVTCVFPRFRQFACIHFEFCWLIVTFSFLLIGCSNYLVLQHSIHMRFIYRCLAPKRYVRVEIGSDKQSVTKCMGRGGGGPTVFNCLLMKV